MSEVSMSGPEDKKTPPLPGVKPTIVPLDDDEFDAVPPPASDSDDIAAVKRKQREENERLEADERRRIQEAHPDDLVARTKECLACQRVSFTDKGRDPKTGEEFYKLTEMNLYRLFDAILIGKKVTDLHCDLSRRMIIDEKGRPVDDVWSTRQLFDAVQVCKLRGTLTSKLILNALKQWALDNKFNDITERIRCRLEGVVWDKTSRLESYLIQTLGLEDSADNRLWSKYWVLSFYSRMMHPGSLAPISMAMFGGQDAGKSHFQRMWCRELLQDEDAAPVTFDPEMSQQKLFRDIYGISIIATIPEMIGYNRADVRKMKATMTDTTDTFDQKFGFTAKWPRQFIFILDSNSYSGLYRDDDDRGLDGKSLGERRWFPVFVGQVPGATGEVRWDPEFRVEFGDAFASNLWQVMKEGQAWMDENGPDGYMQLVHDTTAMVRRFSRDEKNAGQGVVKDETFEEQLPRVLYRALKNEGDIGILNVDGEQVFGLRVLNSAICNAYMDLTKQKIMPQRVTKTMSTMKGVTVGRITGPGKNYSAFAFVDKRIARLEKGKNDLDEALNVFWDMFMGDYPRSDDFGKTAGEKKNDGF